MSRYDGLHVQSLEQEGKEVASNTSTASTYYNPNYQAPPLPHKRAVELPGQQQAPAYNQQQTQYYTQPPPQQPISRERRNPWGLGPLAFAAVVALITAIIIGGAVGGGLGAALSSAKQTCAISNVGSAGSSCSTGSSSNPTTTTTSAGSLSSTTASASSTTPTGTFRNFVPPSPAQVESLYNNCDQLNGTVKVSPQNSRFRLTCPQAILGSSGSNGVTLSETVAYTLDDCIAACSLMNFWKGSTVCIAVTWDNGMAGATAANFGGNCWLFRDSSTVQIKANSTSARLIS